MYKWWTRYYNLASCRPALKQKDLKNPGYTKQVGHVATCNPPPTKKKSPRDSFYSVNWLSGIEHMIILLQWIPIRWYCSELWHHTGWWAVPNISETWATSIFRVRKLCSDSCKHDYVGRSSMYTATFRRQKPCVVQRTLEWWDKRHREEEEGALKAERGREGEMNTTSSNRQ